MKVLVCGGRDFYNFKLVETILNNLWITSLIHGAAKGADAMCGIYAKNKGIPCREFPADWKNHKLAAGCIRNQQMLDEGKPELVVAFPGGRGTADMVARARRAAAAGLFLSVMVLQHLRRRRSAVARLCAARL